MIQENFSDEVSDGESLNVVKAVSNYKKILKHQC